MLMLTLYLREGSEGPLHLVRQGVAVIATPLRVVGSALATPFDALANTAFNLGASEATLSELKAENERLTAEIAKLKEAEATARRLEALVSLQSNYKLTSTAARIIGCANDSWTQTVTLDKGSRDGFALGMPVCNAGGVLGQIIEVSPTSSVVRLITDEQSGVSAMIQNSRAQGTLKGQPDGSLRLSYVPAEAEVKAGDIVISSGLGGVFPKGLPLGTVSSVEKTANAIYYTIVVRPQSSAENNEEVLVITALSQEHTPTADEVSSANSTPAGGAAAQAENANTANAPDASAEESTGE
ncbi:rod shape-determining protein MreC [Collinsella sp. zg1085]|nr:rod shape-determining protein MreC [Collinsella sp. zg1085]